MTRLISAPLGTGLASIGRLVLFLVGSAGPVIGQSRTSVQAGIDVRPDTVTVGQHFTVTVRIRAPQGATIRFPERPETPANVDTAGGSQRRDTTTPAYTEATIAYRVAAWRTGMQQLGFEDAIVSVPGRDVRVSLADSVFVKSVLPADTALRKPKEPRPPLTLRAFNWLPWAIAVAVALLLGLLWWFWRRSRRGPGKVLAAFPWAEREFWRIEALRLIEQNQPERYAIVMAGVLRGYLEREFPAVPSSSTTRELVLPLRALPVVPLERTLQVFERADVLKFAADHISADEARGIGNESQALVRRINEQMRDARSATSRGATSESAGTNGASTSGPGSHSQEAA
jgi:hypothetical protein